MTSEAVPDRSHLRPATARWPYVLTRLACRIYFRLRHRWKVVGLENLPASGGVVVMSNHASHLDPPLLGAALPRPIRPMAKIELFRNPIFGRYIDVLGAFPIRRGEGDREGMRCAIEMVRNGEVLVLFPEGTRTEDGRLRAFHPGSAMLALRAGAPVVPVRIRGTFEAWGKGRRKIRPVPIEVRVGPPVDLSDLPTTGREAYRAASDRIRAAIEAL